MNGQAESSENVYKKRKVAKGRRIFNEGETGDFAYIVETGEVGIYKDIEGSEIEIATLHPGEIFGEVAVLDGKERMASAIANLDSTLVVVAPKVLEERIQKSDKFIKTLLQIFMTNLRDTHKTYKNPSHSLEGHVRSILRHSNAMRDLMQLTHLDDLVEEGGPIVGEIRASCDKLYELIEKYQEQIKK